MRDHHFWILLGTFTVLVFIGLSIRAAITIFDQPQSIGPHTVEFTAPENPPQRWANLYILWPKGEKISPSNVIGVQERDIKRLESKWDFLSIVSVRLPAEEK